VRRNEFSFQNLLRSCGFGTVYLAVRVVSEFGEGEKCAVKVMPRPGVGSRDENAGGKVGQEIGA
jgi:hypothetical protein